MGVEKVLAPAGETLRYLFHMVQINLWTEIMFNASTNAAKHITSNMACVPSQLNTKIQSSDWPKA